MKTKTKAKNLTFPCEVEVTLAKAFEINQWCAQIMHSTILGGKLSFDLARLSNDTEKITKPFMKLREQTEKEVNELLVNEGKLPVTGKALDKRVMDKLQEVLDDEETKFPLRIPAMKMSDFIADKDYKHLEISEGGQLVPMGFLKAVMEWIDMDG